MNEIADRIFQLESSSGRNDGCVREGLGFNGYGYGQPTDKLVCFDSRNRVRGYVKTWFETKLQTMTLAESVCGYNLGFKNANMDKCIKGSDQYPYWKNFQSLN